MDAYDEERERPFCIVSDYPRVDVLEKSGRTKFGPKVGAHFRCYTDALLKLEVAPSER